jgi:hypothetical protein
MYIVKFKLVNCARAGNRAGLFRARESAMQQCHINQAVAEAIQVLGRTPACFPLLFQAAPGPMGFARHAPRSCLPAYRFETQGETARGPLFFAMRPAWTAPLSEPPAAQFADNPMNRDRGHVGAGRGAHAALPKIHGRPHVPGTQSRRAGRERLRLCRKSMDDPMYRDRATWSGAGERTRL